MRKLNKKFIIDIKTEFDNIYCYVKSVTETLDAKTSIQFCDFVIDMLLKNMESSMQLDFIQHERNISEIYLSKKKEEINYRTFPYIPQTVKIDSENIHIETDRFVEVDLSKCYLLCNTRKTESLIKMMKILSKEDFLFEGNNHRAMYIEYINTCAFLDEGVHSLSVAHYLKKGIIIAKLVDISKIFPYVSTDGLNWYINDDNYNEITVDDFRLSLIYEIAKLKYSIAKRQCVEPQLK